MFVFHFVYSVFLYFCVLLFLLCIAVYLSVSYFPTVHVYRLLPPGENQIAVINILYHNVENDNGGLPAS